MPRSRGLSLTIIQRQLWSGFSHWTEESTMNQPTALNVPNTPDLIYRPASTTQFSKGIASMISSTVHGIGVRKVYIVSPGRPNQGR
jgi:hypothetical protein